MDQKEIPYLSVIELAKLIESRQVSPVEVTEAYLARIGDLDFKFNAYITVCREHALKQAREAESAIAKGGYLGPMHGIPVGVKDQIWTKGIRTTGGSRILADFVPDEDATVITNLRVAGAVLLGKTNLSEFAVTGFSHRFSTPRNPWDLNASAGGSSSGSGAGTAAFLCATSIGEDTGGSIRRPAAWDGVVGLRPSWGRVSRHGLMRGVWSMFTMRTYAGRVIADVMTGDGRPLAGLHGGPADLQNQTIGWLRKGCSSLVGGTLIRFPRIWMASGECRLRACRVT